jgi:hypothetical protein
VVEGGGDPRLAQKALAEALVRRQVVGEELERDAPAQPQVLGQVDDAHPAPAEQPLDPVAGEGRPDPGVTRRSHGSPGVLLAASPHCKGPLG